jgi:hypothetical protein
MFDFESVPSISIVTIPIIVACQAARKWVASVLILKEHVARIRMCVRMLLDDTCGSDVVTPEFLRTCAESFQKLGSVDVFVSSVLMLAGGKSTCENSCIPQLHACT